MQRVSHRQQRMHSGKSETIRESNQASGVHVRKAHYAWYYIWTKRLHFVRRKISFLACEFSPIKSIFLIKRKV